MAVRPRSWLMLTLANDKLALSRLAMMLQSRQYNVWFYCRILHLQLCTWVVRQLTSCLG